jgi:predicted ATPase/DNA-binding SARP family transcriptional activator
MASLELFLLGPFQLMLNEQPVRVPLWAKTQALLAYLGAEADRPHRREVLAGLLWPEQPDEAARHSLRQALYQLRRAIGTETPPFLLITPQTVQLNLAGGCSVDVADFLVEIDACQRHAHRRRGTCHTCLERLRRAAALYRGHFLASFSLKDSVPYEEWALIRREQLARLALSALRTLAEYHALRGDVEMLEQVARRQIELDPLAEGAHRQLMCALSWGGRRNAALAHYEALRGTLAAELDVPPEGETVRLHAQIEVDAIPHPRRPRLNNWPAHARLTSFVGREEELAQITAHLGSSDVRLLTLLGPGGVGKSRLALQAAAQEAYGFRDGACWVPLDTIDAPELAMPAIATALHLSLSGPAQPLAQLCAWLREREMLLVLDNCEHCTEAAPDIIDLAASCPQLRILVTSREPLHVRGEHRFPVPPLPMPDLPAPSPKASVVTALADSPALALFVDRARAILPDFALTEENAEAVAEICARLDCLPLAIELAAAHVRLFSPQAILDRLTSRLTLLADGPRDLPARQRTMRASIEWSYALLSTADRALLRRLAVFAGGCTRGAAEAVCTGNGLPALASDSVQSGVASLLDKHLLQRSGTDDGPRFWMYETIREFALECLESSGESMTVHCRHADYYVDWKNRHFQELDRLETELGNLRAAMRWSIASGQVEPGLRIACHAWFWSQRGTEWRYWLDELLRSPDAQDPSQARVSAVFHAFLQALMQGDYEKCQTRRDEHLALANALGDLTGQISSLYLSGYLCMCRQDYEGAAKVFTEGLARETQADNSFMIAMFQSGLGSNLLLLHDLDRAEAALQAALKGFAEIEFQFGTIETLTSLGYVLLEKKEHRRARNLLTQAVEQAVAIGFQSGLPDCLTGLAGIAVQQDHLPRAARLYGAAQELATRFGSASHEPPLLIINDQYQAILRQELDPTALRSSWQEGRQMSLEEALAYGLTSETESRQT